MPTSSNQTSTNQYNFDLYYSNCLVGLANIARNKSSHLWTEWVHEYSLVIFVIGPWEICETNICVAEGKNGWKNETDAFFNMFSQNDDYLNGSSNTTFVWRTWGSPGTTFSLLPKRHMESSPCSQFSC